MSSRCVKSPNPATDKGSIGLLSDNEHCYALYHSEPSTGPVSYDQTVALDTLLDGKYTHLSRRQRFYIAMLLCNAILQSYATPWFNTFWNKSRVFLIHTEDVGSTPAISHIYIAPSNHSDDRIANDCLKILRALGVVLLELCFGKRLQDHPLWEKHLGPDGKPNEFTALATAMEWQDQVLPEAGPEFAEAVRKCLLCAFATQSRNLDDLSLERHFTMGLLKLFASTGVTGSRMFPYFASWKAERRDSSTHCLDVSNIG
jgi:hypothetical protein